MLTMQALQYDVHYNTVIKLNRKAKSETAFYSLFIGDYNANAEQCSVHVLLEK